MAYPLPLSRKLSNSGCGESAEKSTPTPQPPPANVKWLFVFPPLGQHGLHPGYVPAAHWWLSGNVKLGLIWGSLMQYGIIVLVCCAFCMLGNVLLTL